MSFRSRTVVEGGEIIEEGKGKGVSKSLVVTLDAGRAQALILHRQLNGVRYRELKSNVSIENFSNDDDDEGKFVSDENSDEFSCAESEEDITEEDDMDMEKEDMEVSIANRGGDDEDDIIYTTDEDVEVVKKKKGGALGGGVSKGGGQ
ncbi:uncharacterized protein EAF01_004795 [Botrytis porri]|uniref:uncharacterized protein n=1 Tax=Botrytis porri TaxID=87229 RepID=UPI0018FF50DC|nr:uncharacterized protein EAF01_004795 [Botrytis porri]KAF7907208.1 hypothetical protein EAF01_004795 [Botrytis porri]